MRKKLSYQDRYEICKKCPQFNKFWKTCKLCGCFMPLKTKLRWVECPDEPPRWTQENKVAKHKKKPMGKKKKKGGKKKRSRG